MSDLRQSTDMRAAPIPSSAMAHGLRSKIVFSGVIKALQLLLGVGASLLLARWLGASGYGAYSFAFALASLLGVPAIMGWPTLLTREVARFQNDGELPKLKGILRTSPRWVALSSLAAALVCLGVGWAMSQSNAGHDFILFAMASALIPLMAWVGLRAATLRGLDRVITAQLLDGILRPGLFLLCVAALSFGGYLSPRLAMAAQVLAVAISLAYGNIVLVRVLPLGLRDTRADTSHAPHWLRSLWPLMFISAVHVLASQASLFVLGIMSDTSTVGVYKVAVMIGTQVGFATFLVNAVFAPTIVKLHRTGRHEDLQRLVNKGRRYVLTAAIPIAFGVVVFGRPILDWVLGPEYQHAYWPMVVVAAGQLAGVSAGPVGMALGMTGHERGIAKILATTAAVSVILTIVLASSYGATGAAVATATGLVLSRMMLQAFARRVIPGKNQ